MGLLDRLRRRGAAAGRPRGAAKADLEHLTQWAAARVGVEAFVEPATTFTEMTVVLVAQDGEWTRRRVDGPRGARAVGEKLKIPVYDVQKLGYPQRMRDHDERQRILRKRDRLRDLEN